MRNKFSLWLFTLASISISNFSFNVTSKLAYITNAITYTSAWADDGSEDFALTKYPSSDSQISLSGSGSLSAAVSSAGSAKKVIIVDITAQVETISVPSNITIQVVPGGTLDVGAGQILTIHGPFVAGHYKVFSGKGKVRGLTESRPDWFGAYSDKTHAMETTLAFQNSVDAARRIIVEPGSYLIDVNRATSKSGSPFGISIPSNREIIMDGVSKFFAKTSHTDGYAIFGVYDASNITIDGGTFIGDRYTHIGPGEHGYAIDIKGGTNITVKNTTALDFFGDGYYAGLGSDKAYSENLLFENITADNNRRQGMSLTGANHVRVLRSTFSNTKGTLPQAGIDIETNYPSTAQSDILIDGCTFKNNAGAAVDILRGQNVTISNCLITGNHGGDNILGSTGGAASSNIKLLHNQYLDNTYNCIDLGDNIDNILIKDNTFRAGSAHGLIVSSIHPTSEGSIKIINNIFESSVTDGNVFAWGVPDTLRDWEVRGNTIKLSNGTNGILWRGKKLNFEDNTIIIGRGGIKPISGKYALFLALKKHARLTRNSFENDSNRHYEVTSNSDNALLEPDNKFSGKIKINPPPPATGR